MDKYMINYIQRKNLATLVGMNPKTIYRAMKSGKLNTIKVGEVNRIPKASAWEWWNNYHASKTDHLKNLEIKRALGINESDEETVLIENRSSQNDQSTTLIKIHDADYKQKKKANDSDSRFDAQLKSFGFDRDAQGIFVYGQNDKMYLTNFNKLEYICNMNINEERIRIIKLNDITMELKPQDLLNSTNFNKRLLSCSNFDLQMGKSQFSSFKNLILNLDNNKYITTTYGFGRVNDIIFNLGNKVMIKGKLKDYKETIWIDHSGYRLEKTDLIYVSDKEVDFSEIWNSFYQLYGMQAILIIGFAIATLFFQQYMEKKKHFPLLYILAASSRGKNGLSDLICSLFGLNESLANINCASNSTKIGIEGKSLLLHNLPLVLNELSEKHFNFIKSRYDGQGSVKFHDKNPNNISERSVNGSTMVTTVLDPLDKQVVSRCIFIDLDVTELKKQFFDVVRRESSSFSGFIINVLKTISFDDILDYIQEFGNSINSKIALPRIVENYCLIGGCFSAFRKMAEKSEVFPKPEAVISFIEEQIKKTESYLNPLIYFIYEVERLADVPKAGNYLAHDSDYVFFNFNGIWSIIKDSYKAKYFPFLKDSNIKRLLEDSDYMAIYGPDFVPPDKSMLGKPVSSHPKKIDTKTKRCFVLKKDKLPGYYR